MGNKNYYKGNRTGRIGRHTSTSYVIDYNRLRNFVLPEKLSEFQLTPYIAKEAIETNSRRSHTFRDYFRQKNTENTGLDQSLVDACRNSSRLAHKAMIAPRNPQLLMNRRRA